MTMQRHFVEIDDPFRGLGPIEFTHAFAFSTRYAEKAASSHAEAARCAASYFNAAAIRHQTDAAYYSKQARRYLFRLIDAEPE